MTTPPNIASGRNLHISADAIQRVNARLSVGLPKDFMLSAEQPDTLQVRRAGPVAVVSVDGPICFQCDWFAALMGGIGKDQVVNTLQALAADASVLAVVLDMNCPGGESCAQDEIVAAVRGLKKTKPVYAVAHPMICSLAYAMAALSTEIVACPTSLIGSIGTLQMIEDSSKMYEEIGIKAIPIASHPNKGGSGWPGVPVTEQFVASRQKWVNDHFDKFVNIVGEGRGSRGLTADKARALNALTYGAEDAVQNGLADRVSDFEPFIAELVNRFSAQSSGSPKRGGAYPANTQPLRAIRPSGDTKGNRMADENKVEADTQAEPTDPKTEGEGDQPVAPVVTPEPQSAAGTPATLDQLKKIFGTDTSAKAMIVDALDAGLTVDQAKDKLIDSLRERAKTPAASQAAGFGTKRAPANASAGTATAARSDEPKTYPEAIAFVAKRDKLNLKDRKAFEKAAADAASEFAELHRNFPTANFKSIYGDVKALAGVS